MASINVEPNGRRMIQFVARDGKRKTIRLGKISQRDAERIRTRVEQLVVATFGRHALEPDTAAWLAELDGPLREKLVRVGLAQPLEAKAKPATLQAFLDGYIAKRKDVKDSTRITYRNTRRNLISFFGAEKPLPDITAGDADSWRLWLVGDEGLADNTVRRRCACAKQFFRAALRSNLIAENPFEDMKGMMVRSNRKRDFFVTREMADAVLEACPDAQWRLLFALSRYGGLRCPSEHLRLRWGDIDWERGRFTVHAPKTERHDGHETRIVPLFPELRPYLEAAWDEAEPGTEFVITRYRDTNMNLRTQLLRIIAKAKLQSWPKIFHNLRATRQTELAAEFPIHVVCDWIGNSKLIAQEHYLRTTEADFAVALQNPMQQPHVTVRTTTQRASTKREKTPENPGFAKRCNSERNASMGVAGLEPATSRM